MFGIVSDAEFEAQLEDKKIPPATIVDINRGRGTGRTEVPVSVRKLIAAEAIEGGSTGKELSEAFGISESSVSAYKNGATSTSTYNKPDEELKKSNDEVKEKILTGARSKLMNALENITPDKLADTKVRDLAGVAKDMSAIIKNMEPQSDHNPILNQQFVFHAPIPRKESDFEVIEARD